MANTHTYSSHLYWTGNRGTGTKSYTGYDRTWTVSAPGKPDIPCSNDPLLGGDPTLMNPEDMLISSLSGCHMLWYLHLAFKAGISVISYEDSPLAVGENLPSGAGRFLSATLRPKIVIAAGGDIDKAHALHDEIHAYCFIARSVNFPVSYEAEIRHSDT